MIKFGSFLLVWLTLMTKTSVILEDLQTKGYSVCVFEDILGGMGCGTFLVGERVGHL